MAHTGAEVLAAYKEQHGIERNFGFLKDPLLVNGLFLKRPDRIEALGFVLLASLLAWSLAEHAMRSYLAGTGTDITGGDKEMTRKPATFMTTTSWTPSRGGVRSIAWKNSHPRWKFKGLLVARIGEEWFLTAPFTKAQQQFVQALVLSEEMILKKSAGSQPARSEITWERSVRGGEGVVGDLRSQDDSGVLPPSFYQPNDIRFNRWSARLETRTLGMA